MNLRRVWWRRITNNDLYNIEKPLPPGPKGQLHIDVPNVPDLFKFFGYSGDASPANWPPFEISAKCLRDPKVSGQITFRPRPKNSRYDIPQQNINAEGSQRHPAWTSAFGWPAVHGLLLSTEDAASVLKQAELRILILQDSNGEYFADYVLGSRLPSHLPPALKAIFDDQSAASLELDATAQATTTVQSIGAEVDELSSEKPTTDIESPSSPKAQATPSRGIRHPSAATNGAAPVGAKRQGSGLTASEKKAVEMRALEVAIEHFTRAGFTDVRDVGDQASYDLTMLKDGRVHFVEVKGTTGSGTAIALTRNEVAVHQEYFPNNALAVVRGISLTRGESPIASGGTLQVIQPWQLENSMLVPLAFEYKVPES